jgi:hypothetical protein
MQSVPLKFIGFLDVHSCIEDQHCVLNWVSPKISWSGHFWEITCKQCIRNANSRNLGSSVTSLCRFCQILQRLNTRLMPLPVAVLSIHFSMLVCLGAGLVTWSGVAYPFTPSFRLQTCSLLSTSLTLHFA